MAARRGELLEELQHRTINVFRLSKCQGLAVPHATLVDGAILPRAAFTTEEDVATLATTEPEFQTFPNLFGLRFTRYVVLVKDKL